MVCLPEKRDRDFPYSAHDAWGGEEVGTVWFAVRQSGAGRKVRIHDIEVFERFRRGGFAAGILEAVEQRAGEPGSDRLEPRVFGHNAAIRAFYAGTGYTPTSIVVSGRPKGSEAQDRRGRNPSSDL